MDNSKLIRALYMGTLFKKPELAILLSAILLLFNYEYNYIFMNNPVRAIFIGLWPPTILLVLVYFNLKLKR